MIGLNGITFAETGVCIGEIGCVGEIGAGIMVGGIIATLPTSDEVAAPQVEQEQLPPLHCCDSYHFHARKPATMITTVFRTSRLSNAPQLPEQKAAKDATQPRSQSSGPQAKETNTSALQSCEQRSAPKERAPEFSALPASGAMKSSDVAANSARFAVYRRFADA
jgi:hypothetical protein